MAVSAAAASLLPTIPAELRTFILAYVLRNSTIDYGFRAKTSSQPQRSVLRSDPLSLLLSCKQIKAEVLAYAYRSTTLNIHSIKSRATFLQTLPDLLRSNLHYVAVRHDLLIDFGKSLVKRLPHVREVKLLGLADWTLKKLDEWGLQTTKPAEVAQELRRYILLPRSQKYLHLRDIMIFAALRPNLKVVGNVFWCRSNNEGTDVYHYEVDFNGLKLRLLKITSGHV